MERVAALLADERFERAREILFEDINNEVPAENLLTRSVSFLVGQWIAWQQLAAAGQFVTVNPSNAFFYLLTGLHGLHILGGMYVWVRAMVRSFNDEEAHLVRNSVELCTIYWHFLLLVWLILFGFLLST